jgi:hypothetical protein
LWQKETQNKWNWHIRWSFKAGEARSRNSGSWNKWTEKTPVVMANGLTLDSRESKVKLCN